MKDKLLAIVAVGLLAGPMAASAVPIAISDPCINDTSLACVTGITGLELTEGIFDVEFVLERASTVYAGTSPLFLGNQTGAAAAIVAIVALLDGQFYGPVGTGSSFIDAIVIPTTLDAVSFGGPCTINLGTRWVADVCNGTVELDRPGTGASQDYYWAFARFTPARDVPEPTTLALFGLGLAGLGFGRRRKHT